MPTCRCGHAREAHAHLRRGTDCALCTEVVCRGFRRQRPLRLRSVLDRLTGGQRR